MTRGLRLVDKDEGATPDLAQPPVAPTQLWRELVEATDHELALAVMEGTEQLLNEHPDTYPPEVLPQNGVTALSGAFASVATNATRRGGWTLLGKLHNLLADLPTNTPTAGLDDVRAGPITLLELVDEPEHLPELRIELPLEFWDVTAEQRRRWLAFLGDVSAGLPVELALGPVDRRRLCAEHSDVLPASVNGEAKQTTPRTTAARALSQGVAEGPSWSVLKILDRTGAERAPLSRLYNDVLTGDVSKSAVRHRVSSLAEDGLVHRITVDGERHVALTAAGRAALDLADGADRSLRTPSRESEGEDSEPSAVSQNGSVNNPQKLTAGTVDAYARTGQPPRPDGEVEEAAAPAGEDSPATTRWLGLEEHHAAAAAAEPGEIALDDCRDGSMMDRGSHGDVGLSTDLQRREVVVSINFDSTICRTATRLAAALASDEVAGRVLTDNRLQDRLQGLANGNLPVLRLGRQLGWLSEEEVDPVALRQRLGTVRNQLLSDLADVGSGDNFDQELAADVTRRAHGLAGTVSHILDMLGFDLIRTVDVHNCSQNVVDDRAARSLGRWMAIQTAISSRYGHYNAYRVLFEQREEYREAMLGSPVVDEPTGDVFGSWVIRGVSADKLAPDLQPDEYLEPVDERRRNAEAFLLEVDVVDANRREAVAAAVSRIGSFRGLEPTSEAVSLLHSTVSTWGAAEALSNLGEQDLGTERPLLLDELRYALGTLDPQRLLPTVDGSGAAATLSELLNSEGKLSKGEVARRAGITQPTVSSAVDVLQALGLVDVEDLGAGRADLLSPRLPDKGDRDTAEPPRPLHLNSDDDGEMQRQTMTGALLEAVHRLEDIWIPAEHPELWEELQEGRLTSLVERWPWIEDLRELLARMVGPDLRDGLAPAAPSSTTYRFGRRPDGRQTAIGASGGPSSARNPHPSRG